MQYWPNSMKLLQIPDSLALWSGQAISCKNIVRILFWSLLGFSSNFGYNPSLYGMSNPNLAFFSFLWKSVTGNSEFEFNIRWGLKFSFHRFLPYTHKKFEILSVIWWKDHQYIPISTMINFGLICSQNYEMGVKMIHKGEWGQNFPKIFQHDLWMTPNGS